MTIKDILSKASINEDGNLDESFVQELEDFIEELVEAKAKDKAASLLKENVEPVIEEVREELSKEYENKFEEFKNETASSFSVFVDSVLDEELAIPEDIVEWAAKGKRYDAAIQSIRAQIAIDEDIVNEELQSKVEQVEEELASVKDEYNTLTNENFELRKDAKEMATHLYVIQKCKGLSEANRERVIGLLEGIKDIKQIDEKFDFIVDNVISESDVLAAGVVGAAKHLGDITTSIQDVVAKTCVCPNCGNEVEATENTACSLLKCPICTDIALVEEGEAAAEANETVKQNANNFVNEAAKEQQVAKYFASLM